MQWPEETWPLMPGLRDPGMAVMLDFAQLAACCAQEGLDPSDPEQRQRFNERLLAESGARYLIGRYGEDHGAVLGGSAFDAEARTVHMGVDVFCARLEPVFAPAGGRVVLAGREPGPKSFGHYVAVAHAGGWWSFFGHLERPQIPLNAEMQMGEPVGNVGSYEPRGGAPENGGWSRHLHYQVLTVDPAGLRGPDGVFRIGYSTRAEFERNAARFPDPSPVVGLRCSV